MGDWSVTQTVGIRLKEARTGKSLWEKTFTTSDGGVIAAYYGRDPMRCGYPADTLVKPVIIETISAVDTVLAERGRTYWDAVVQARPWSDSGTVEVVALPATVTPTPTPPPSPPPVVVHDNATVAVVIGVSKYAFIGNIDVCASDARQVASALTDVRGVNPVNVAVMTDGGTGTYSPTKATISERIRLCADEAGEDGMAFVYFSGHAVTRNDELLIIPQDCRPANGIPVNDIMRTLATSKARDKVLVIDACHAGAAQKGMLGISPDLAEDSGVTVFLSCSGDEFSYPSETKDASVYTDCFVDALSGLASGGRAVTAAALHSQVEDMMRRWRLSSGKKQHPRLIQMPHRDTILVPARD